MISGENGQALLAVLALLVLGGLAIVPSLNYATTSLNAGRIIGEGVKGGYAADAGVEDALWSLGNSTSPSQQLSEKVNKMEVTIQTEEKGIYTLYLGELIQPGGHSDYLDIDGEMIWDGGAEAYKYTITITWQAEPGTPPIHLEEVGARLPIGYNYQSGSAADFVDNLSINEPDEILDALGAYLLNWELEPPYPSISEDNPVQTQIFYITGEGNQEGDYAWIVASREDIGAVGEITGTSYKITAAATRPEDSKTTAKIVTDVIVADGTTYIVSWKISM